MVQLLAVNTQFDIYLKTITPNNISKDFDIEKELEGKSKTSDTDNSDTEVDFYLENSFDSKKSKNIFGLNEDKLTNNFQFSENHYCLVYTSIPIPPPDYRLI